MMWGQARNQLETPGGEKSLLRGDQTLTMPNIFKLQYVQHIFPGERKILKKDLASSATHWLRACLRFKPESSPESFQHEGFTLAQGYWHSENLINSPLVYHVSYLHLKGLSPPIFHCGDGTGSNFTYAVLIEIRTKSCNHRIK